MSFTIPKSFSGFKGYTSRLENSSPELLAPPSQNCLILENGKVAQRFGYMEEFSIGVPGSTATAFYHKTYDIAFFALGTKLYYRDFTTGQTYDTGVTLTAGTTTRFKEFFGDIYLTNTTDGIIRICVFRLNDVAANAGDATFTVDVSGLGRMNAFNDTSGNFRINGTNESVSSFVASTGVCTHTTTLSQNYADNSIILFIDNSYSSLEKPSDLEFWKSRMHIMGFPSVANTDQPNNTVLAGQFVSGAATASGNATDIQNIIDFTFGTGGSTKITVHGGGKVTKILGVKELMYFFTESQVHATASSEVADSGSLIGSTVPVLKDELHGCINEDCAAVMGNNAITYVTNDKRVMVIPIATDTGAAISAPVEDFDVPMREHFKNLDKDQTGAFAYHYRGGRQTIYQLREAGQWKWFIFDHNINSQIQGVPFKGNWQPPQQISPITSPFERDGVLYGTDPSTDKVYSFFTSFTDNLSAIQCVIATGDFNVGDAMMKTAKLQGDINHPSQINIRCYVTNNNAGRRSGSTKIIDGSTYAYTDDFSIGALPVGSGGVATETTNIARWSKDFDVFPSEANFTQLVLENFQDGGYCALSSYSLTGDQYSRSFQSAL